MYFDSVEEARETVPFALKNMTRLPESDEEWVLDYARSDLTEDGICGQNALISYSRDYSYEPKPGSRNMGTERLSLSQRYVGSDAYLEYTTVYDIEKVMIGSIEAAAVSDTGHTTLLWIADEMLYELSWAYNEGWGMYSLEKLIVAAESIQY